MSTKPMVRIQVYFTENEAKLIKKNAGNSVMKTSPYLRKFFVDNIVPNGNIII